MATPDPENPKSISIQPLPPERGTSEYLKSFTRPTATAMRLPRGTKPIIIHPKPPAPSTEPIPLIQLIGYEYTHTLPDTITIQAPDKKTIQLTLGALCRFFSALFLHSSRPR
jgi:hypothetical protein